MKKWSIRIVLIVLLLALLAFAALLIAAQMGERKMQRHIELTIENVDWRTDAAAVERGHYLFLSRGCADCHDASGSGKDVVNDGKGLLLHSPNISVGPGSVVLRYTQRDWLRSIRHGVKPDGRPAMLMPSEDYARLTDDDVMAIAAYAKDLPPVRGTAAEIHYPMLMNALYGLGVIRDSAETIDHSLPPSKPVPDTVSVEHGAYVASSCVGCHGEKLSGGKIPGTPPDWPPAANLTPGEGSAMTRYPDAASFTAMLRSGKRPDGSAISRVMPFNALKELNDTDVQALYLHLKSLAPRSAGQR
jgi:cytochrome c553